MIEIFILSLVQGITEFLPISSSSHLVIFSKYLDFENQSLSIDVSLHIGSFIAVVAYFYRDIIGFINNKKLQIIDLLVIRLSKHKKLQSSKPCANCIQKMKIYPKKI